MYGFMLPLLLITLAIMKSLMVTRDLKSRNAFTQIAVPKVQTATLTPGSGGYVGADLQGYSGAQAVISTGAVAAAGVFNFKLQESDDNTTFTDVIAAEYDSEITPTTTAAANTVYRIGYRGAKRYIAVLATLVSGTSLAFGINIHKGMPQEAAV